MKLWKGEATLIKIISLVFYLFFKIFLSYDSFYFKDYFICLAAAGLNCSAKDLLSGLQHAESLVVACGVWFPQQGWNLGVLATGPQRSLKRQVF